MWVFTSNSYISAVQHRDHPSRVMVRARFRGDLEAFFGPSGLKPEVVETPKADYRFRTTVHKDEFADALLEQAEEIDYPNFKDSVRNNNRHNVYMDVWRVMHAAQKAWPKLLGFGKKVA
jgi:hypothetical protein